MADQPNLHHPAPPTRSRTTAWAADTACALAWLSAVPSFYWALGGTAGLHTVGGAIEELARSRDPAGVALGLGAGLLKVAGGLLALALVRPWGRAIPRRLLGGAAWAASVVLTAYGGLLVAVGTLVLTGLISPSGPVDRTALRWHVLLWDLWFLVWGLVLGVAAWQYGRESRRRERDEHASHGLPAAWAPGCGVARINLSPSDHRRGARRHVRQVGRQCSLSYPTCTMRTCLSHLRTDTMPSTVLLHCVDSGHAGAATPARDQMVKASSSNATASRRVAGSSTASS